MAKNKRESRFTTELKKSFLEHGAFWWKLMDLPHFAGMMTRFDAEKPFDAISVWKGIPIALEIKSFGEYQAFGMRHLRPCQEKGLDAFQDAGGLSFVFLNIRRQGNVKEKTRRVNNLIIFDWNSFSSRDSSVKKKELLEMPAIAKVKGIFDLREFFDGLEKRRFRSK